MSFVPFTLVGTGGKSVLINADHVTHIQPSRVDAATPVTIWLLSGAQIEVNETAQEVADQLGFEGNISKPRPETSGPPAPVVSPGVAAWSTGGVPAAI